MISDSISSRHIHRLSLCAPTAELAQHSAVLLSDALHTASMPVAEQGRLVIIRRLNLGKIDPHVSSASLALQIEKIASSAMLNVVSANSPQATNATAVSFNDYTEALILLIRRIAVHQAIREWYWYLLFPELKNGYSRSSLWQILLIRAHNQPAPLKTVATVVNEAFKAGCGNEIIAVISSYEIESWLYLLGLDSKVEGSKVRVAGNELDFADPVILSSLYSCLENWGTEDLRSFWLTAIVLLIARPSLVKTNNLSARVSSWLQMRSREIKSLFDADTEKNKAGEIEKNVNLPMEPTVKEGIYERKSKPLKSYQQGCKNSGTQKSSMSAVEKEDMKKMLSSEISSRPKDDVQNIKAQIENKTDLTENAILNEKRKSGKSSNDDHTKKPLYFAIDNQSGEWSQFAGMLFLVPVLERLGICQFLELNPEMAECCFPQQFLINVGRRVGMIDSDPVMIALTDEESYLPGSSDFELNSELLKYISGTEAVIKTASDAWMVAVRHWCRMHAKMGLINLICRKGFVMVSRMHIDICFDLNQTDIRLRRQAIDVNPGWVPWLGRIIRFHYRDKTI